MVIIGKMLLQNDIKDTVHRGLSAEAPSYSSAEACQEIAADVAVSGTLE